MEVKGGEMFDICEFHGDIFMHYPYKDARMPVARCVCVYLW